MKTKQEQMVFAYSIAKRMVEEQGKDLQEIDLEDQIQNSILRFVVIRDFPFLEEDEIKTVLTGIKTIVDLAIAEQQLKLEQERKKNEKTKIYCY